MRNSSVRPAHISRATAALSWRLKHALVAGGILLLATGAQAQTAPAAPQEPMTLTSDRGFGSPAEVLENAPIYLLPDATRLPLRIAKAGSQLRVLQQTADWANVQFQDPQLGLRTGYVQTRFLRIEPSRPSEPEDAAITRARTQLQPPRRSESTGFFIGGGFEANAIIPNGDALASTTETGRGAGVVAGYGFTPLWSVYGALSVASMDAANFTGTYSLTHIDAGTRIHFASPARRTVPFVQVGLSARTISQDYSVGVLSHTLTARGPGVVFGGGVNVHFMPAVAFSASATWMAGPFTTYKVDDQTFPGESFNATDARIQIGLVLFPRGQRAVRPD